MKAITSSQRRVCFVTDNTYPLQVKGLGKGTSTRTSTFIWTRITSRWSRNLG